MSIQFEKLVLFNTPNVDEVVVIVFTPAPPSTFKVPILHKMNVTLSFPRPTRTVDVLLVPGIPVNEIESSPPAIPTLNAISPEYDVENDELPLIVVPFDPCTVRMPDDALTLTESAASLPNRFSVPDENVAVTFEVVAAVENSFAMEAPLGAPRPVQASGPDLAE